MCVQTELPVWLLGGAAAQVARERGLVHVADEDSPEGAVAAAWTETAASSSATFVCRRRTCSRRRAATG